MNPLPRPAPAPPDGVADFLNGLTRQLETAAHLFQARPDADSTATTPSFPNRSSTQ